MGSVSILRLRARLEAIKAWNIWDVKRLGALEPGCVDAFEGQDSLGKATVITTRGIAVACRTMPVSRLGPVSEC